MQIPEPWKSFLSRIDGSFNEEVNLHCFGGFVVTMLYGLARATVDVDVMMIAPASAVQVLVARAGEGSELHREYGVYLDFVTIASVPEDYDQRLTEMFPREFKHLRLFAFDPYDVALAKLERNFIRDRDDVKHLARTIPFDLDVLKDRYEKELRPYLGNPAREDLTLRLWLEAIEEERSEKHPS
ncbi:MAG: DUF6036 family nucleotidyltransferase [Blastocatellia bacterium]